MKNKPHLLKFFRKVSYVFSFDCNHWNPPHPLTASCKEDKKKKKAVKLFLPLLELRDGVTSLTAEQQTHWTNSFSKEGERLPPSPVLPGLHRLLAEALLQLRANTRLHFCCFQGWHHWQNAWVRVKLSALAAEPRLIQREELKYWYWFRIITAVRILQRLLFRPHASWSCVRKVCVICKVTRGVSFTARTSSFQSLRWIHVRLSNQCCGRGAVLENNSIRPSPTTWLVVMMPPCCSVYRSWL